MVKGDTYNNKHLYHSAGEWENLYGTITGSYRSEMHGCTNCWNMNVFIMDWCLLNGGIFKGGPKMGSFAVMMHGGFCVCVYGWVGMQEM